MIYDTCECCGKPLVSYSYSNSVCIDGWSCPSLKYQKAYEILYQSNIAIFPVTELSLVECLIDNGELDNIADAYTADYVELSKNDYLEHDIAVQIQKNIAELYERVNYFDFLSSLGVPLLDVVKTIGTMNRYKDVKLSVGHMLVHWEQDWGMYCYRVDGDDNLREATINIFKSYGTVKQVQRLFEVLITKKD